MLKWILTTPDGDVWEYDNKEDARRTQYIFGGVITMEGGEDVEKESDCGKD